MTWDQALLLMVKLSGFKLLVRANRFGCDTDLARDAHDMLLAYIDEFREDLGDVVACWHALLAERDPRKAEDIAYQFRDRRIDVEHFWLHNHHPYVLGGWRCADKPDGFRIPDQFDYELFGSKHWVRELADEELCGLRPILDQLTEETGQIIPAVAIYYRPTPDRAAVWEDTDFDLDAEIPW